MAIEEQVSGIEAASPPKRKRGRLIMIIAVVLLLALGGGGFMLLGGHGKGANSADAKQAPQREIYLALEPAFVVNFRDEQDARYLQVGVSLMSHDQTAIDAAKDAQPVIRNALLMLFSGQSYQGLIDAAGKQKLQVQALAAVQKIINDRLGKPGVDALYFTSFVMQ